MGRDVSSACYLEDAVPAILHLALGAPTETLISGCDLREPVALPFDLGGVRRSADNRIAPPAGDGLGIRFDDSSADEPERRFSRAD